MGAGKASLKRDMQVETRRNHRDIKGKSIQVEGTTSVKAPRCVQDVGGAPRQPACESKVSERETGWRGNQKCDRKPDREDQATVNPMAFTLNETGTRGVT